MPDESLIAAAEPDRFTHESPIRAFTEFRVAGTWAIGKGFRPSLAHMHTYLDAMQHKEGWHLVQMLDGGSLDPTLIFQRDRNMAMTIPERSYTVEGPKKPLTMDEIDEHFRSIGFALVATPEGHLRYEPERKIEEPVIDANDRVPNVGDDPTNPAYYDGTACAEIIEHMPTNVGITAKYVWRLGEKDAEKQECGKAAWYLKRELAMLDETVDHGHGRAKFGFASPSDCAWYRKYADERINAAQKGGKLTTWRATAMSALVSYTITGEASFLHTVIGFLEGSECFKEYGNGLAI